MLYLAVVLSITQDYIVSMVHVEIYVQGIGGMTMTGEK